MVETIPVLVVIAGIVLFGVLAVPPMLHNVDTGANIIDQLFDVDSENVTDGDILVYDNATSMWQVQNITQFLENQTKGHINVGGGAEVFKDENATDARFRTIIGTGAINVQQNLNDITISTGGGPNGSRGIANIQTPNGLFEAAIDEDTVDFIGNGIAISNGSSVVFEINATIGQLNNVNTNDTAFGDVLILNQTSGIWENELLAELISLSDVYFNAEEATVDDLTGIDCVNDITYNFFDNTDPHEYARQVVEFCADSDPDDNLTWLYVVPKDYTPTDFKFRLFWSDDNADAGAFMALSANDCEEGFGTLNNGDVTCTSTDLELHQENPSDDNDIVGMRFTGVTVPQGATILDARIQFHVDEVNPNDPLTVTFHGEDADSSAVLTTTDFDLSSRTKTTASVNWAVPHWANVHDEGAAQLSADLSTIVQEIVDRGGWVSGNDMSLFIDAWPDNTGERHAESQDGEDGNQPELTISYSTGGVGPVCFEIALMPLANTETLDLTFSSQETVCVNRSGLDQLSTTEWTIPASTHGFAAEDLVFIKIHRPDDFVVNDFESDVYVLGGSLEWLN
jgi:hypothetical protein